MDGGGSRRVIRLSPRAVPAASDERVPIPARTMGAAAVSFVQRVGDTYHEWSVVEVDARAVPGARGPRCLIFTRDSCIRRVWEYPAHWRTLDADELTALSWHR